MDTIHPPIVRVNVQIPIRIGLLAIGTSLVTVALLAWGVARATAQVAALEQERTRSDTRLAHVEQRIGGFPTTVADAIRGGRIW